MPLPADEIGPHQHKRQVGRQIQRLAPRHNLLFIERSVPEAVQVYARSGQKMQVRRWNKVQPPGRRLIFSVDDDEFIRPRPRQTLQRAPGSITGNTATVMEPEAMRGMDQTRLPELPEGKTQHEARRRGMCVYDVISV